MPKTRIVKVWKHTQLPFQFNVKANRAKSFIDRGNDRTKDPERVRSYDDVNLFFGFLVLVVVIVVAFSRIQGLVRDLEDVKRQLRSLKDDLRKQGRQPPIPEEEIAAPLRPAPSKVIEPRVVTPVEKTLRLQVFQLLHRKRKRRCLHLHHPRPRPNLWR